MRILFITKHNPFSFGGGSFATKMFINLFSTVCEGNIDLCMAKECYQETDLVVNKYLLVERRSKVSALFGTFFGTFHRYNNFVKRIKASYDLVVLDNSAIGGTFVKFFKKNGIKTFVIHHNFESEYFLASYEYPILRKYFLKLVVKNENRAYINSFCNIFLTEDDKNKFEKAYGNTMAKNIILNPFVLDDDINMNTREKKYDLVISCSLNSVQNKKTIINFFNKYYKGKLEKYKLLITGRAPSDELVSLVSKFENVTLIPNPTDEELHELLLCSHFYLCPIEIGGGIKIRCFDALRFLMPAIVHKNSIRGFEKMEKAGYFKTYETVEQLVNILETFVFEAETKVGYSCSVLENYGIMANLKRILSVLN